jgi:hypothetical protein
MTTTGSDPIEEMLMRESPLDGANFTSRVMAQLPPRRRDLRPAVRVGSAAIAAVLAAVFLPTLLPELLAALSTSRPILGPLPLAALLALASLGAGALVLATEE